MIVDFGYGDQSPFFNVQLPVIGVLEIGDSLKAVVVGVGPTVIGSDEG